MIHFFSISEHVFTGYLCIEGCSLLNLAFVESFAERVSIKTCVFVHYFPWLLKQGIVLNTYERNIAIL